ncbi:27 kDa hemolymph protein-like isoform X2 [Cylas formicarius]|uniref:27 kDa hemolymph protein-like isoform X2 n=1 Tax=Cylas formicarius TaxID=197179 RepID=UPI00295835D7|nr:27 kDa hemolymph protein-like isoform X2 [Cylas formicarius]
MKWFIVVIFTSAVLCFEYDKNNISALDDVVAIKQKCNKHGKDDSYERLTEAIEKTMTCIDEIVHFESVNAEFEKARKTGSLDELFGKYCTRRPEFRKCLSMTTDVAEECLLQNERESLSDMGKWVEQITEFACFKNGDRIAMFVAEGGIDCLISRTRDILNCINDTLKFGEVHFDTTDIDIPNMSINKEKCRDFTKIQECIVQDLEKNCIKHTSANMVDSLLEFIKRNACNSPKEKRNNQMQSRRLVKRTIVQFAFTNSSLSTIAKLQQICQKYGSEDSVLNLMIAINKTHCKPIRFLVTPREDMIADLRSCSKPLILAMEDCLKEEAKYFPTFLMENIISVLEFGYTYANTLQKATSNRELLQCFQDIKRNKNRNLLIACFKENVQNDIFNEMNIPPKETMCGKMYSLNNCVKEVIKKVCINDVEIDTLIRDLVNALHKPCFNH